MPTGNPGTPIVSAANPAPKLTGNLGTPIPPTSNPKPTLTGNLGTPIAVAANPAPKPTGNLGTPIAVAANPAPKLTGNLGTPIVLPADPRRTDLVPVVHKQAHPPSRTDGVYNGKGEKIGELLQPAPYVSKAPPKTPTPMVPKVDPRETKLLPGARNAHGELIGEELNAVPVSKMPPKKPTEIVAKVDARETKLLPGARNAKGEVIGEELKAQGPSAAAVAKAQDAKPVAKKGQEAKPTPKKGDVAALPVTQHVKERQKKGLPRAIPWHIVRVPPPRRVPPPPIRVSKDGFIDPSQRLRYESWLRDIATNNESAYLPFPLVIPPPWTGPLAGRRVEPLRDRSYWFDPNAPYRKVGPRVPASREGCAPTRPSGSDPGPVLGALVDGVWQSRVDWEPLGSDRLAPTVARTTSEFFANPGMGVQVYTELATGGGFVEPQIWVGPGPDDFQSLPTQTTYARYFWSEVEPRRGEYDFSVIERDICLARARGARLAFRIVPFYEAYDGGPRIRGTETADWRDRESKINVPHWMRDLPQGPLNGFVVIEYAHEIRDANGELVAAVMRSAPFTNEAYYGAAAELMEALATRYDGDPDVEFLDFGLVGDSGNLEFPPLYFGGSPCDRVVSWAWTYPTLPAGGPCALARPFKGVIHHPSLPDTHIESLLIAPRQIDYDLLTQWYHRVRSAFTTTPLLLHHLQPIFQTSLWERGVGQRSDDWGQFDANDGLVNAEVYWLDRAGKGQSATPYENLLLNQTLRLPRSPDLSYPTVMEIAWNDVEPDGGWGIILSTIEARLNPPVTPPLPYRTPQQYLDSIPPPPPLVGPAPNDWRWPWSYEQLVNRVGARALQLGTTHLFMKGASIPQDANETWRELLLKIGYRVHLYRTWVGSGASADTVDATVLLLNLGYKESARRFRPALRGRDAQGNVLWLSSYADAFAAPPRPSFNGRSLDYDGAPSPCMPTDPMAPWACNPSGRHVVPVRFANIPWDGATYLDFGWVDPAQVNPSDPTRAYGAIRMTAITTETRDGWWYPIAQKLP